MFKDRFNTTITPAQLLVTATTPVSIGDNSTDLYDVTTNYACLAATSTCTTAQQTRRRLRSSLQKAGRCRCLPPARRPSRRLRPPPVGDLHTNEPKQDTVTGTSVNVGTGNTGNFCTSDLGTARQYGISFKDGTATYIFNTLPAANRPTSGGDRYATFAGGGFLPTPVPWSCRSNGKYYQSVIRA